MPASMPAAVRSVGLGDPPGADHAQLGDGQEPAAPQGVGPGHAGDGHRDQDDGRAGGRAEQAERPAHPAEPVAAPALARDEGGARRHVDRPARVLAREEQGQLGPPSPPPGPLPDLPGARDAPRRRAVVLATSRRGSSTPAGA